MPTALLSVYDKTGIVELASVLHEAGWRLLSSGGTARALAGAGLEVVDVAELTGLPAILDHRVVTLHPVVHGGLLADPTDPVHRADMAAHGIEPIDMVVVNLYPFASSPSIDLIDIGGPAMVRASIHLSLERAQPLRYGENPHQAGARYRNVGERSWWDDAVQHNGKDLSYLNLYDTEAAWRLVHRFDRPACVIVKHANPCGVAVADSIPEAYVRAHDCDPVSAFGGIVALNRPVPAAVAEALAPVFTEVIVAPEFDAAALEVFAAKPNLRVVSGPPPVGSPFDVRSIDGGLLVQHPDRVVVDRAAWRVVTTAQPTERQWDDLLVAWQVCAAVSSNAIVYVNEGRAVGIGAGQQNRLDSARLASERAGRRAAGGVCASDAFFPFRDGLDVAAAAGVRAVVQPGGSVRDAEVIEAADEHGIAMVFTGTRHFRH
jgi:phosphoribosylaminoimidazolecarboxamide formyltransferase/IMP cyclohydrolase